jgi:hypothetical protein
MLLEINAFSDATSFKLIVTDIIKGSRLLALKDEGTTIL